MNPLFRIDFSISDSLKIVRKSVLIYETIIVVVLSSFVIALIIAIIVNIVYIFLAKAVQRVADFIIKALPFSSNVR